MAFELFNLAGRRALVTRSSQGIGLAIARGLAEHGASVVLNGRDRNKLDAAAGSVRACGHDVAVTSFDVTRAAAVRGGILRIEQAIGPIDILVNNAGMQFRAPLEEFPAEKWDELLTTNVSSAFYVGHLTRGMCADWAKYGLQANAIAPGYFKTPLNQALIDNPEFSAWLEKRTPASRWGNVDELIGAAVFLSGEASSFVNGHTLYVDGGITTCL
ncbi:SDR family oxidoreductase [Bradyrhizobium genosp. A]|uniref:SDR family oxidoreductase n=1 Tax=Bradyrhizobium genosp. A TaxID=83626 RepID=UPI003CF5BA56